jgi:hypothetical protein
MKPKDSLPHSQAPATCPYPEPQQSSTYFPSHFLKFHFNKLPSMPRSSKWSLSFKSPHRMFVRTSLTYHKCHMRCSWFDHQNNILWKVKVIKLLVMLTLYKSTYKYKAIIPVSLAVRAEALQENTSPSSFQAVNLYVCVVWNCKCIIWRKLLHVTRSLDFVDFHKCLHL